ncbi:hypothetical protein [Phenylobacterium sp.]|uniref:hypothetical protein n=1 Tax=Phenylobacterium sp. TaxID=1871053 RepID=UPI0035B2D180
MPGIALVSQDERLYRRVRAAAEGLAGVTLLQGPLNGVAHDVATLKPSLLLFDLNEGLAAAELPDMVARVASAHPSLAVLVLGDAGDDGDVLAAMRAGCAELLHRDASSDTWRERLERHLRRLEENERAATGAFSLVLSAQPGGGAGLFALNLALLCARRQPEALLIDCQLPASEAGAALDIAPAYTISDAVRDFVRLDRSLVLSAFAHHPGSGLRLLPLSVRASDETAVSPEAFLRTIRAVRSLFGETVLNAAGIRHALLLSTFVSWASDVYLVCPQKFTALRDAKDLLLRLPHDVDARRRVTLIVDEYSPMINVTPEQMQAALGLERVVRLPAGRDELINGLNLGRPIALERPHSPYMAALNAALGGEATPAGPWRWGVAVGEAARRLLAGGR